MLYVSSPIGHEYLSVTSRDCGVSSIYYGDGDDTIIDKIHKILKNLKEGVPQALARFNDGEIGIINNSNFVAARGCQKGSSSLQEALRAAIRHEQENYWVGIPCDKCATKSSYNTAIQLVRPDYEYLTKAVVNTNRNWKLVIEEMPKALEGKEVIWVSGSDQNLESLREKTGIKVSKHLKLPKKDSWRQHSQCLEWLNSISGFSTTGRPRVVVLSCGPLSRVLSHQGFIAHPDTTFLDLGSTFDPYTRNVWHSCHRGTLNKCEGCN